MRVFCSLLFILITAASMAFAQTERSRESRKFFEFGKVSENLLKEKLEAFYKDLKKDSDTQGYIINYGTNKEISKREKQLRDLFTFRDQDGARLTFVHGGIRKKFTTEFWIVPNGAEPPTP